MTAVLRQTYIFWNRDEVHEKFQITTYENESFQFHSQESDRMILSEYIFHLLSRHLQLLFTSLK